MGQAFDALGINLPVLIAFLINFGLLFYLLKRFLWGPIRSTLDQRIGRIQESLSAAERAAQHAVAAEEQVQAQIRQAQIQGQEIVANAQQISQRIQEDANRQAREQTERLIAQAQVQIQQQTEAARAELRREFADLTILAAERVIRQSLDRQAHVRLINEVLAEAGTSGSGR